MAKNDLGRTMIDELKLCYVAELSLLDELSQIQLGGWAEFDKFTIFRVVCEHYQYGFDVLYTSNSCGRKKVATFKFGRYGEQRFPQYVIYRIENETLYNQALFNTTLRFPEMLGVEFEHITSIDLCRDYKFNVVSRIRKIAKDDKVSVLVNGKVIDKRADIDCGKLTHTLNFYKTKNPTLNLCQKKARKDKIKGLTLCAYNKNNEIATSSNKEYIREFYGNPKTLHRLEIHQNCQEIKDYLKGAVQDITLLSDQGFLDAMFLAHLSSLLRFNKGRKHLDWQEILQ